MSRELLVVFSSLGVLNGFFLVIYFFFISKDKSRLERLLALLFLAITVRIGKSVLFYFTELDQYVIHIGLVANSMIGPFFFLYFAALFKRKDFFAKIGFFHLLPSLGLLIFSFFIGYREDHQLWIIIIRWIVRIWLIYIVIALIYILRSKETSEWSSNRTWHLSVFISVFLVCIAYMTNGYTSYIVGALTFTVLIYFLMLVIFMRMRPAKKKARKAKDFVTPDDPFYTKLNQLITEEELYTNPDLTMPEVAKALSVTPHFLSEFLNESMQTNFPKFINHYRIGAAIIKLKMSPNLTMDAIAFDSGFNSLSTFYSAFKSVTNMTPAKFKENL